MECCLHVGVPVSGLLSSHSRQLKLWCYLHVGAQGSRFTVLLNIFASLHQDFCEVYAAKWRIKKVMFWQRHNTSHWECVKRFSSVITRHNESVSNVLATSSHVTLRVCQTFKQRHHKSKWHCVKRCRCRASRKTFLLIICFLFRLESEGFCSEFVEHFCRREPAMGVAYEVDLCRALLPDITCEQVRDVSFEVNLKEAYWSLSGVCVPSIVYHTDHVTVRENYVECAFPKP